MVIVAAPQRVVGSAKASRPAHSAHTLLCGVECLTAQSARSACSAWADLFAHSLPFIHSRWHTAHVSVFSNTNHFYLVIRIWWPNGDSSQCCFGVPWDTENHWPKSQVDPSGGSREAVKSPDKGHRDPDRWVTPSIENLEARSWQVQASMGNYCKYWDEVLRPGLKDGVIDQGKTVGGS